MNINQFVRGRHFVKKGICKIATNSLRLDLNKESTLRSGLLRIWEYMHGNFLYITTLYIYNIYRASISPCMNLGLTFLRLLTT